MFEGSAARKPARDVTFLALVLSTAWTLAACERCDGCQRSPAVPGAQGQSAAVAEGVLHAKAAGRATLTLVVESADLSLGQLRLRASGPRSGWIYDLDLVLAVGGEGGGLRALAEAGRCDVRYLQDGRATAAEMAPQEPSLRVLDWEEAESGAGAARLALSLRCRKRFDERTDGKPYAAPLPESFDLTGVITTQSGDGR